MTKQQSEKLSELYQEQYRYLLEYAKSCLHNDALAEEALQDAFHIACQKPDECLNSESPKGWMKKTLSNVICNTWRKQNTAKRILTEYYEQQAQRLWESEDAIDFDVLYQNIADTEELRLIREVTLEGKSYQELSEEKGVAVPTLRKRVQRAKEYLRKKLKL